MKLSIAAAAGLLLCAVSVLLLSGCGDPEGSSEDGKRWYAMHNCTGCHGYNGNDGRAKAIAGIDMGYTRFVRYLRNPRSPSMPKFDEQKLPKQDTADIYVYLKSLPK